MANSKWFLRLSLLANMAFVMRTLLYERACYSAAPVDDGDIDMMNEYIPRYPIKVEGR